MRHLRLPGLSTALLALLGLASCPIGLSAENTGIVSVDGHRFTLNGATFYYAGCNNYYQMVYAADPGLRPYVEEVQAEAADLGLTVLRTWAFNDGASQWNALQTSPGVYQEYVFQGLDYVLYLADQHGLRLILPLVNNWDDYGGMNQYVEWSGTASEHDDFYTDENCQTWYKDHIVTVLNRVNTFNGRVYREDPTVFAWELANEPRCETDPSGATLEAWIEEMSAYIKSVDSMHLVTTGSEGFYGPAGPAHNPYGWMSSRGVDFIPHHAVEMIDFACVHAWPDWWSMSYEQSMSWMRDHIDDCTELLGKPVILEEFGKQRPVETRDLFFQGWYGEIYLAAEAGEAAAGSNLWILYHDDYPDYDGFGVYCPEDSSTCTIIADHSADLADLVPFVSDVAIANSSLPHTDDYIKDRDVAVVTATVTDDDPSFGIGNIMADLSGLGGGASVSPDTYVGTTATWTLGSVTCSPANGMVTVTVSAVDPLGNTASPGSDDIIADNTAPTAVTGFDASPAHEECDLSWTLGMDTYLAGVTVRRVAEGECPTYGAFVGDWPDVTGHYPADQTAGTEVYNGSGTSHTDGVVARDIYFYQAFCYDEARNYGPSASTARDFATNYWLGDVADGWLSWGYDGLVDPNDIEFLSHMYTSAPTGSYQECDVGPTVHPDGGGLGVPLPDDLLDFEDLMIFGLNYGLVGPRVVPLLPLPEDASGLSLVLAERPASPGAVEFSLVLSGNVDEVKGLSVEVLFDPADLAFESACLADAMASPLGDVFFWSGSDDGRVQVDLAVLGRGATLGGSGEVAVLAFRPLADEYGVGFGGRKLRDVENRPLAADSGGYESGSELPAAFRLHGNVPNPFVQSTAIAYEVPHGMRVSIRVHDVSGRLVRTLVDGVVEPGRRLVTWDGRNDAGEPAGSGVYFCSAEAAEYHEVERMLLLK